MPRVAGTFSLSATVGKRHIWVHECGQLVETTGEEPSGCAMCETKAVMERNRAKR